MTSFKCTDILASNGVINFDADAFVNGTPARYVGNPSYPVYLPGEAPLMPIERYNLIPGPELAGQPVHDAFKSHEKKEDNNGFLNGLLVGGILAGAAYGISKINGIKNLFKSNQGTNNNVPPGNNANAGTSAGGSASSATPPPSPPASAPTGANSTQNTNSSVTQKVKDLAVKAKDWFIKLPKTVRIGTYVATGLGVLYGTYKLFSGGNAEVEPQAMQARRAVAGHQTVAGPRQHE